MVSVLMLNWNTPKICIESIINLLKEQDVEIVLVDNGSDAENVNLLKQAQSRLESVAPNISFIYLNKNYGNSLARNFGIQLCRGEYIFLLDGDIIYVAGTIPEYKKLLSLYPKAACVGYLDDDRSRKMGGSGTRDKATADSIMPHGYSVKQTDIALTQYGLFRASILRKYKFPTSYPFSCAGWGYEDNWLHELYKQAGYLSVCVDKPIYYHDMHSSFRELEKAEMPMLLNERLEAFKKQWGKTPCNKPYKLEFDT
jgi:GT2 family glycosyltransferase